VTAAANIIGICGAPCTGKTTLAEALVERLRSLGLDPGYLQEPARLLVALGVKIDSAMGPVDYDAFLRAYTERDRAAPEIAVADRTPIDHYSYIAANRNLPRRLRDRHRRAVHKAMERYALLLYLPLELELEDDSFRVTSREYQSKLDKAIRMMLGAVKTPHVILGGTVKDRLEQALNAIGAELPGLLQRQGAG